MHESTGAGNTVEHGALEAPSRNDNAIPKLALDLEQLCCAFCHDPISRYEMVAIWPSGRFVSHLACWAQDRGIVSSQEGRA